MLLLLSRVYLRLVCSLLCESNIMIYLFLHYKHILQKDVFTKSDMKMEDLGNNNKMIPARWSNWLLDETNHASFA